MHCFLNLAYNGIRAGSGLGFAAKPNSDPTYWSDFLVEWMFYFFIMLVMLNLINGIVVDTFQDLRQKNSEKSELKDNSCFICSINRSDFEAFGVDYDYHIHKEHNILDYFHYIFKINSTTNKDDFSSCEYDIYMKIKKNMTDFFPVKQSMTLERIKSKAI